MLDAITDPWLFIVAGLLLNLTPGADIAYTVSRGAAQGPRAGVVAALGIGAGCLFHVALAALGLSAAIAASALAFTVLKLMGAAYLACLGATMIVAGWRARVSDRRGEASAVPRTPAASLGRVFRDGMLINATNPKVALFFIAFLPQFVVPGAAGQTAALWLLGAVFTVNGTVVNALIGASAGVAARRVGASARWGGWLQVALGAGFIGLALRLAWVERR